MRDSIPPLGRHLRQRPIVAVGEEAGKAEAAPPWLDDLPGQCAAEDVHLGGLWIWLSTSIAEGGHADRRRRLVLPVLHHAVDALRADGIDEPLHIRAGHSVQGVDAEEGGGVEIEIEPVESFVEVQNSTLLTRARCPRPGPARRRWPPPGGTSPRR